MGGARGKSKAAIADAAATLFAENGYAATTVRDIARAAGADASVVVRHFGSKEQLFLDTMSVTPDDMLRFDPPLSTLGERLVRYILDTEDRVRGTYLALIRASGSGEVGSSLTALHEDSFVAPLTDVLVGADRELRARLVAAMVGGLMYALWVVQDEALTRADPEDTVRVYGAALQLLIDPAGGDRG